MEQVSGSIKTGTHAFCAHLLQYLSLLYSITTTIYSIAVVALCCSAALGLLIYIY